MQQIVQNPYDPTFGRIPQEYIRRNEQLDAIGRQLDESTGHIFLITGPRACGKTVMLADLSLSYQKKKDWIVINLSPDIDMVEDTVYLLEKKLHSFSRRTVPADQKMEFLLAEAKKKKKALFLVDEVVSNESMHAFAGRFQIFLRADYPVFLVMAGLYENVQDLKNQKSMTFLYRAPRISLPPLNLAPITVNYMRVFQVSQTRAMEMARLTEGYPFAFQALGSIWFDHPELNDEEE